MDDNSLGSYKFKGGNNWREDARKAQQERVAPNSSWRDQPYSNQQRREPNARYQQQPRQRTASPEYNESHLTQTPRKTASADVQRFWNQLAKRVLHTKNNKFELNLDEYSLWFETWKAAAAGATGPVQALPIAYLMLPATTNTSPAPSTIVAVLIQVRDVQLLLKWDNSFFD